MQINTRRILWILMAMLLMAGGFYIYRVSEYWKTLAINHIQAELQNYQQKTGIQLNWKEISISLITPKITAKNLTIHVPNYPAIQKPIFIKELKISPDYMFILLKRHLTVKIVAIQSSLKINTVDLSTAMKLSPFTSSKKQNILISNIILKNTALSLSTKEAQLTTDTLDLYIKPHMSLLKIYAETQIMQLNDCPVFNLKIKVIKNKNKILLRNIAFHNERSHFKTTGVIYLKQTKIQRGWIKTKSSLYADDFEALRKLIFPKIPYSYQGQVSLNTNLQYKIPKNKKDNTDLLSYLTGNFNLSTKNFKVKDIFFSTIKAQGKIQDQVIQFNNLHIIHPSAWQIHLAKASMHLKPKLSFRADVSVHKTQLHSVFQSTRLKKVPVLAQIQGNWKCYGEWMHPIMFNCKGEAQVKNLLISKNAFTILKVPAFKTKSEFQILDNIFSVKAEGQTESSYIYFTSYLDPQKNFKAQIKAKLDFTDIEDLAHLTPKGTLWIQDGNINLTNKLSIQAHLITKNATIKNIHIGNAEANLKYTNNILNFQNIKGNMHHSRYQGRINIHLFKNTIKAFARMPFFTLEDLIKTLNKKIPWQGSGNLIATVHGPLEQNALNYRIQSQLSKFQLTNERFDSATVHIESKKGFIKIKQMKLLKNNGVIHCTGHINKKANVNLDIIGNGLALQDSTKITKQIGKNWLGTINFGMSVHGIYSHPFIQGTLSAKDTYFKGQKMKNSELFFKWNQEKLITKGTLFNTIKIQEFILPHRKHKTVQLKASFNDFNASKLLSPTSFSPQTYHFSKSKINGDIKIVYKKNQFLSTATGHIKVNQLLFKTSSYTLKNHTPFHIQLKNGGIKLNTIQLTDNNANTIKITQKQNIDIQGNVSLNLLNFLFLSAPILEGNIKTHITLNPYLHTLKPIGNIQLTNGIIQLHPALEPFESVHSQIAIQNNKWKIQSIQAKIAKGSSQASGYLLFTKNQAPFIHIQGKFYQFPFNSLSEIHAQGTGRLQLTGHKMPYTLKVITEIENARINREFGSKQNQQIHISKFLPKKLKTQTIDLIKLQLNMKIKTPAQIVNSTVKASMIGQLQIIGTPKEPLLSGNLQLLPSGSIFFRDHQFKITSGSITYQKNEPSNPFILLTAETTAQEQNSEGDLSNKYNILLRVRGQGKKAKFYLTSTPTLNENEIISLLAFGSRSIPFQSDNNQNITTSNIAKYSYYQIGSAFFQKALDKELQHIGLDQFLIVPNINSQKNTVSTKLILKKNIFNKVNISTSRTILDDNPENNIKAEFEINKNTSLNGFWKNEKPLEGSDLNTSVLGIDLEYQVDF